MPIDPREFGALEAKVANLEAMVSRQGHQLDELLELANKGRGGFWAGMTFVSVLSSAVGFAADHLLNR